VESIPRRRKISDSEDALTFQLQLPSSFSYAAPNPFQYETIMQNILQKQEARKNEAKIGHQKVVQRLNQNLKKAKVSPCHLMRLISERDQVLK
jgi:hypothetical protein